MLFVRTLYSQVGRSALLGHTGIKSAGHCCWSRAPVLSTTTRRTYTTKTTMTSSNIVLPTLEPWAEQHLTALFTATTPDSFNAAYDAFFTKNPTITLNGKHISSDKYKSLLSQAKFAEAGAQVTYTGAVAVPEDPKNNFGVRDFTSTTAYFTLTVMLWSLGGKRGLVRSSHHRREIPHSRWP